MSAEYCLNVRDLSIAFRSSGRETLAVDRISFDIFKGECLALVGESGSGKSATASVSGNSRKNSCTFCA